MFGEDKLTPAERARIKVEENRWETMLLKSLKTRIIMEWKYFWIAVAVLGGSWKVISYSNFASIPRVSPLKEILFFMMLGSILFISYFLYDKYI